MQKAGEVLKDMMEGPIPPVEAPKFPRGLVTKLCEVMGAVKRIKKSGHNSFHNYDYVTEADLADAIRDQLADRHVFVFPDVIDVRRTPHEIETMKGIRKTQLSEIMVRWTFVDGDTGEAREVNVPGVGEDASDKGFYKAFTGSEKYMLMKTFLVPTGDDPERESKTDAYDAKEKQARVAAEKKADYVKNRKQAAPMDDTLVVTEWGDDGKWVSLSGGGLNILRSEMPTEEAKTYGIKRDNSREGLQAVIMPSENLVRLEAFCIRIGVATHRTKGAKAATNEGPVQAA